MKLNISLCFKTVIAFSVFLTSCNRYIDVSTGKTIPVQQGYLNIYQDSNVLTYRSNISLTRDTEKIHPKPFKVKLPKRIKYYEFVGSSDFFFYYDKNQVVLIKVNLESQNTILDTSYIPSDAGLNEFFQHVSTGSRKGYNIKEITSRVGRANRIIKKGDAEILLYNITKENEGLFSNYLSSLVFIDN